MQLWVNIKNKHEARLNTREIQDAISRALRERPIHLGLRSDFNVDVRAFADNKQLKRIDSRDWQVVFGRRGAGKTTLLATYARHITTSLELDAASIELSVSDFKSDVRAEGRRTVSDAERAQIYFADFLDKICTHLGDVFFNANENSKFFRLYKRAPKQRHIENLIEKIASLTQESKSTSIGAKKSVVNRHTAKNEHSSDSGARVGGSAAVDLHKTPTANISIGGNVGTKRNRDEIDANNEIESIAYFKYDYGEVRNLISELLLHLGLKKLYIFLDEWSELDKSASTMVQPHFADLLKRVFWNKSDFVLKIACVRNQTRFSAKIKDTPIGLELSADIFEIDLDYLYSNSGIIDDKFYEEMLFRHLSVCNEDLLIFQRGSEVDALGAQSSKPVDTFTTYIFKNRHALSTLVTGAGGLPRDFMEIFDAIGRSKNYSVETPWTVRDIKEAVRHHYILNKSANLRTDNGSTEIYDRIFSIISTNKDRLFVVSRKEKASVLSIVAEFHYHRLIHDVPLVDIPATLRTKYFLYYADLGFVLDASRELIDDVEHIDKALRNFKTDELQRYII